MPGRDRKSHPRWRLLLAGNRDEFHARPTAPLAAWAPDTPAHGLLAGRDLQSGGTWAGVGTSGRCAVVTNVRDPQAPGSTGSSRGELPTGFLAHHDRELATAHAQALLARGRRYAPFNLLLADAQSCVFVGNHPRARRIEVASGIHGMSNGGFDEPWPKTRGLCQALEAWLDRRSDDPDPLWRALADETVPEDGALPDTGVGLELERVLAPAFVRGATYGTRASTLIALDHAGRGWISERRFGPNGVFEGETTLQTR